MTASRVTQPGRGACEVVCRQRVRLALNEVRVGGACEVVCWQRVRIGGACEVVCWQRVRVGGACGPPPPVAAPLVPRCALLPAATPRDGPSAAPSSWMSVSVLASRVGASGETKTTDPFPDRSDRFAHTRVPPCLYQSDR